MKEREQLNAMQSDAFERNYALKWLTALISSCEIMSAPENIGSLLIDSTSIEALVQSAASLLATCAGTAAAGIIARTFAFDNYASEAGRVIVTVDIIDVPLDNHDYGSVGAQTWGGACIMAEMIVEDPVALCSPAFRLEKPATESIGKFRCLELGAGTGLVSLTIGKLVEAHLLSKMPKVQLEIVATDHYPTVLQNLERNIGINFPPSSNPSTIQVHPQFLDWSVFAVSSPESDPDILQHPFDVVYGADIIYEAQHAEWIKACLRKVLRKPNPCAISNDPLFHLIIPLRVTHASESSTIETVFKMQSPTLNPVSGHQDLVIHHKDIIVCDADTEGHDEVEYAYYKIGWSL